MLGLLLLALLVTVAPSYAQTKADIAAQAVEPPREPKLNAPPSAKDQAIINKLQREQDSRRHQRKNGAN